MTFKVDEIPLDHQISFFIKFGLRPTLGKNNIHCIRTGTKFQPNLFIICSFGSIKSLTTITNMETIMERASGNQKKRVSSVCCRISRLSRSLASTPAIVTFNLQLHLQSFCLRTHRCLRRWLSMCARLKGRRPMLHRNSQWFKNC